MSLALNPSAIWSSLFILDTVRPFASTVADPAVTYRPLTNATLRDKELKLNTRHNKLAAAVACIGASSPESKIVTACSSEVQFIREVPVITLRIAQNQPITEAELGKIQELLNVLNNEIQKGDELELDVKAGMVSTSMCSLVSRDL
jgi:hypothetical protein